jgi:hypothetical protein
MTAICGEINRLNFPPVPGRSSRPQAIIKTVFFKQVATYLATIIDKASAAPYAEFRS